ncbi:MAG: hypothetical protein KDC59_10195 [Saprospiraceae bacterium]|nr:hypothetical protein [Saprospiraceae bacterium]HPG06383.1 hypothetical protein [Saprospiraceae bacterium]HPR02046.1 hypothetical protein [Saprospiraceae bacterium]
MKYLSVLLLLGITLLGCNKDPEKGSLTLDFTATYGDEALVLLQSYLTPEGHQIQFSKSDFYISNVYLIAENGDRLDLSPVEFVDLTSVSTSAADAANGFKITFPDIEAGKYTRLGFGIGLDPTVNATQPADYPSSNPLSLESHYWTAWGSYIFSKTEGFLDTLGTGNLDLGFVFHTGMDDLYRQAYVDVPININATATTSIQVNIDHETILFKAGNALDIPASPVNHNPNNLGPITKIIDNLVSALSVQVQ